MRRPPLSSAAALLLLWLPLTAAFSAGAGPEPGAAASGRRLLCFYYTWYGTPGLHPGWSHWDEHGHRPEIRDERGWEDIGAAEHPLDGLYDSFDPQTIRRHAALSEKAGIDGWIATWWRIGDDHDRALKRVLETLETARSPIEVAPYYETCGGSMERAERDLRYLLDTYGSHPRFLRHQGNPVVFVYSRAIGELKVEEWQGVASRLRKDRPVVLIADSEDPRLIAAFGGGHNYNPVGLVKGGSDMAAYYRRFVDLCRGGRPRLPGAPPGPLATATVIPGYDDRRVREPGLHAPRLGGETYARLWRDAAAAEPDWILISTFNEWHEGTEIEPSREHGSYYIEETRARAAAWKGFESPLKAVRAAGAGEGIEVQLLAAVPALPGFPQPVILLQRDLFRDCLVLRNLAAVGYRVALTGFEGTLLRYASKDDGSRPPEVHAVAVAAAATERLELELGPRDQLHLWKSAELEHHLLRGGYRGAPELSEELRQGLVIECGEEGRLTGAPGLSLELPASVHRLRGGPGAGARLEGGLFGVEGDPRVALKEGKLRFSRELQAGSEVALALVWRRGESLLHRSTVARIVPPLAIDSVALKGRELEVAVSFPFPADQRGPLEAILSSGEAVLARRRPVELKFNLPAGLERAPPAQPRSLEISWNTVPVRRRLLLGAEIEPGTSTEGRGLRHLGHSGEGDGNSEPATALGRPARAGKLRPGAEVCYLYFALDPDFLRAGATQLEVEYLDQGAGWFRLHYDSTDERLPLGGAYRETERLELPGSGTVKTHSFRLADGAFRGRQNFGADFRICSRGTLKVLRVTARKAGG